MTEEEKRTYQKNLKALSTGHILKMPWMMILIQQMLWQSVFELVKFSNTNVTGESCSRACRAVVHYQ